MATVALGLVPAAGSQTAEPPPPAPAPTAVPGPTTAPGPTTIPIPPPAAFIVVDADTGAVLLGEREHERRPPASITKLLTALIVRQQLPDDSPIRVSASAEAMPARKLNIKAGQIWKQSDLRQAMLLCSCNDVARALAENAGGSVGGFGSLARTEATRLGVVDSPVLQDPAGLDADGAVRGGNRVSAYDMAIIARAFEADPVLAAEVKVPSFEFVGPDGVRHTVVNHNRLFGTYEGAIGVKTGFTAQAGATLVAAATRNGRTILTVIMGSQDIWYHAPQLLDYGFQTPVTAEMARLPVVPPPSEPVAVPAVPAEPAPVTAAPTTRPPATAPPASIANEQALAVPATRRSGWATTALVLAGLVAVLALLVALRRRQVVRRRAARARARARDEALHALVRD